MLKIIATILILSLPLATWYLYKPVRVLLPAINGVTCVSETLCIDDVEKNSEASKLYDNALTFVNAEVGKIASNPRVIFCTTEHCNQSFGFHAPAKAHSIGISAIVVSPQGWHENILRHEFIHHLQAERLGVIGQWRSPDWFKEGMAYSLSQDARPDLSETLLNYKIEFDEWYKIIGKERLWLEAGRL
jgi:hypothetical protein